jgi:hypothetical protein
MSVARKKYEHRNHPMSVAKQKYYHRDPPMSVARKEYGHQNQPLSVTRWLVMEDQKRRGETGSNPARTQEFTVMSIHCHCCCLHCRHHLYETLPHYSQNKQVFIILTQN